jgi:hypothetical protein
MRILPDYSKHYNIRLLYFMHKHNAFYGFGNFAKSVLQIGVSN